jgi:uncharacterized peroxidase-related enzyme
VSRIAIPSRDSAPTESVAILDDIDRKFGVIPNLFRLVAISPNALKGYVGLSGPLSGAFDLKTREQIAIAVAQVNGCDYCLSAHTYLGSHLAGLTDADMALNRKGSASDPKTAAIVAFATAVAERRGQVSDRELSAARLAGLRDSQLVEIVAIVAENFLTNFMNNVAQTDIDFPVVRVSQAA